MIRVALSSGHLLSRARNVVPQGLQGVEGWTHQKYYRPKRFWATMSQGTVDSSKFGCAVPPSLLGFRI